MSNIKRQCNIDLFAKADKSLHSPCVHVNQYDYGYDIAFYIFDNYANPFKIDNGSVVIITGTKKDKKGWVGKVNGHSINSDVPENAKFTDTVPDYGLSVVDEILCCKYEED